MQEKYSSKIIAQVDRETAALLRTINSSITDEIRESLGEMKNANDLGCVEDIIHSSQSGIMRRLETMEDRIENIESQLKSINRQMKALTQYTEKLLEYMGVSENDNN